MGGNRIGTEEIESALLLDTEHADSPVANCVVVGLPDAILGCAPCAFIVPRPPRTSLRPEEEGRLRQTVKQQVGIVPSRFVIVPALPETHSGKYMRSLLRALGTDASHLPNIGAVKNPECIEPLREAIRAAADRDTHAAEAAPTPARQTAAELMPQILEHARRLTGNEIRPSSPLMSAGLTSLGSVNLVAALQAHTGLALPPTLVFEHATPQAIAAHLASLQQPPQQLQQQQQQRPSSTTERAQIGIVGASSRWPGDCVASSDLQRLATRAVDAVSEVPPGRWEVPSLGATDASHTLTAGFLASIQGVQLFDRGCFGVSLAEALETDPQQRLLLQAGLQTFAHASYSRNQLTGSQAAVLLAISNQDWGLEKLLGGSRGASTYAATGGAISIAAGRISFALGLHGPCESVDTACSSSAVAAHMTALHISATDCSYALTAAVTLVLTPHTSVVYARTGMLSPDGRCKTWDAGANGYVRGEGVGAIVIRETATDSDPFVTSSLATLCSSSVLHDGTSASLTAPNGRAQVSLICQAVGRAATAPALIESHGTGTTLGDPTEVRALTRALDRAAVSGIKSAVGHLEPAAGMIGLQVAMLALEHRESAPNAQLRTLNPHIESALHLVVQNWMLPSQGSRMAASAAANAGLSSFAYSGTIAHVTLAACSGAGSECSNSIFSAMLFRRRILQWAKSSRGVQSDPSVTLPFLGTVANTSDSSVIWEQQFTAFELAFLQDHRVATVSLLPGTCYIEMARAVVRAVHDGAKTFDLTAVAFSTILFLDELDAKPTIRVALDSTLGSVGITSRFGTAAWDMHSTMDLKLCKQTSAILSLSSVQARVSDEAVAAEQYYKCTGNDYRGEFRSMQEASACNSGAEVLSHIVYDSTETERVHLRSCAWLGEPARTRACTRCYGPRMRRVGILRARCDPFCARAVCTQMRVFTRLSGGLTMAVAHSTLHP